MFSRTLKRNQEKQKRSDFLAKQDEMAFSRIKRGNDQSGFYIKYINSDIGSGVFTSRGFEQGQFLIEYRGDLLTSRDGIEREKKYSEMKCGCFIYFFRFKEKRYCIDATQNIGSIGRMVNDAANGSQAQNCKIRILCYEGKPHLCIFATRNIEKGEELRYDYGVPNLPWRKKKYTIARKTNTTKKEQDKDETYELSRGRKRRITAKELPTTDKDETYKLSRGRKRRKTAKELPTTDQLDDDSEELTAPERISEKRQHVNIGDQLDDDLEELTAPEKSSEKRQHVNIGDQLDDDLEELKARERSSEKRQHVNIGDQLDDDLEELTAPERSSEKRQHVNIGDQLDDDLEELKARERSSEKRQHVNIGDQLNDDLEELTAQERSSEKRQHVNIGDQLDDDLEELTAPERSSEKRQHVNIGDQLDTLDEPTACGDSSEEQMYIIEENKVNRNLEAISDFDNIKVTGLLDKFGCPTSLQVSNRCHELIVPVTSDPSGQKIANRDARRSNFRRQKTRIFKEKIGNIFDFPDSDISSDFDDTDGDKDYEPEVSDSSESEISLIEPRLYPENETVTESDMYNSCQETLEDQFESNPNVDKTCDENQQSLITVMTTGDKVGSRSYDKRYFCPYCSTPQAKLPRHLVTMHANEPEVTRYTSEKNTKEKNKLMCKIRNLGNHLHNSDVIKKGRGTLIVVYRPCKEASWEDYLPCDLCLGYYVKTDLWKHQKRCPLLPDGQKTGGKVISSCRMLLPVPNNISQGLKTVLSSMSCDDVSRVVKSDDLIIKLGEKLFLKHGHDQEQHSNIRNTLRELGRILTCLRRIVGSRSGRLADYILPAHFKTVIDAVKQVAGFDNESHLFKTPSLALKVGHSIKKCAKILRGMALQSGDEGLLKNSSSFLQLCEDEWSEEISTHALRTFTEKKRNIVKLIPLTSDCRLLAEYLKQRGADAYSTLEIKRDCTEAWVDLAEVTLVQIILFNRRRQGEVSKMTVDDFKATPETIGDEVTHCLSELEKQLCKSLKRIEIVGKRGRTVPIILTSDMMKWLDLLVKSRTLVGVSERNKYVFARASYGSLHHIRGSDCLRKLSEDCGAVRPELLRSTKLRKQIATLSQILNLKDNEMDLLANFLGHDIRVHREFYRLPESTLQVAKISKLLFSLEHGQLNEQVGRTLSEIEIDIDEDLGIDVEEETSDKEESDYEDEHTPCDEDQCFSKAKRSGKKQPWSEIEKAAINRHFQTHIELGRIPKKDEACKCLRREPSLKNRTWKNIKDFVRNKITTKKNKCKVF